MHTSIRPNWVVYHLVSLIPQPIDTDIWSEEYNITLDLKYEPARQFYIQIPAQELEERPLPPVFTNVFRKKKAIQCQTLELMKRNQKVGVSRFPLDILLIRPRSLSRTKK